MIQDLWNPGYSAPCSVPFVYKAADSEDPNSSWVAVPNVYCVSINESSGPNPAIAYFSYILDGNDILSPFRIEEINSSLSPARTLLLGDRVAVKISGPNGILEWFFHGDIVDVSMDLDSGSEKCIVKALSVVHRLWNRPIKGKIIRQRTHITANSDDHEFDIQTDLPCIFNRAGKKDCLKKEENNINVSNNYPVFVNQDTDESYSKFWSIGEAVSYLLNTHVIESDFVSFPVIHSTIKNLLSERVPVPGVEFDPEDSDTWTLREIKCDERRVDGRDLIGSIYDIIKEYDKEINFVIDPDSENAKYEIVFSTKSHGKRKKVYAQKPGSFFDPTLTNVSAISLNRSVDEVANSWEAYGDFEEYEVSLILCPGFPMDISDCESANIKKFDSTDLNFDFSDKRDAYRIFIFDEAKEGVYEQGTKNKSVLYPEEGPLNDILFSNAAIEEGFENVYAEIRRKPLSTLMTKGSSGQDLEPILCYSKNYSGEIGKPWNPNAPAIGTGAIGGDWQKIENGWRMLSDRIGIRVTAQNPENWAIGSTKGIDSTIRTINKFCKPYHAANNNIKFMLTCVIRSDSKIVGKAAIEPLRSPIKREVLRTIESPSKYRKKVKKKNTWFNKTEKDVVVTDDTEEAISDAENARYSTDLGVFSGTIKIPYITKNYKLGDAIEEISGRNISLRTDNGISEDLAVYPSIQKITYSLYPQQCTDLFISDIIGHSRKVERKLYHT